MAKPCDICGDPGVIEAIITCSECNVAREHLYCMRVFTTQAPPNWCCEECDQNKLVSPKTTDKEQKTEKVSTLMQRTALVIESPNKNLTASASQFNFKEKWVDKGKTKYLSCDEAVKLSSGSMKEFHNAHGMSKSMSPPRVLQQSPGVKATRSIKSPASCERVHIKSPQVERNLKAKLAQSVCQQSTGVKEKATPSIKSPASGERARIKSPQKERNFKANLEQPVCQQSFVPKEKATPSIKSPASCERARIISPQEEGNLKANLEQPVSQKSFLPKEKVVLDLRKRGNATLPGISSMLSERVERKSPETEMKTSCKNHAGVESRRSDAGKPNLTRSLLVSEMGDPYVPSLNSYWKGCFYLSSGPTKFNDAFKAHPPSRTPYKVFETVKKMPENIYFELVSSHEIQLEIFPADRDDIGVYFFPAFRRKMDENAFAEDISMIDIVSSQDLVMRSYVNGVELLVLSSRVLPSHSQEFQGNYFLWGVFRSKTVKKVTDKRPLLEANCDDAPPGFKKICTDDVPPGFNKICNDDVPPGFKKICKS